MGPADYTMLISCFGIRHDHFVLYTSAAGLSNPGRGKRKEAENYQHAMQAERHAYRPIKRPILSQDEGMIRERSASQPCYGFCLGTALPHVLIAFLRN